MADNVIVMPGSTRLDLSPLGAVAREFGWEVRIAGDGREVAAEASGRNARAVLLCRDAFGTGVSWQEAIRLVQFTFAGVPVIALHGFAETIGWPELCDAGAFHSLWLPLKENEVRQSLGFLANARKRTANRSQWSPRTFQRVMTAGSALPA